MPVANLLLFLNNPDTEEAEYELHGYKPSKATLAFRFRWGSLPDKFKWNGITCPFSRLYFTWKLTLSLSLSLSLSLQRVLCNHYGIRNCCSNLQLGVCYRNDFAGLGHLDQCLHLRCSFSEISKPKGRCGVLQASLLLFKRFSALSLHQDRQP